MTIIHKWLGKEQLTQPGKLLAPANSATITTTETISGAPLVVAHSLSDLSVSYDAVISGNTKDAYVKLTLEEALLMVVIAKEKNAYMVVDAQLHGTRQSYRLFESVRLQLQMQNYSAPHLVWASSSLVTSLNALRLSAQVQNTERAPTDIKDADHFKRFMDIAAYGIGINASDMHIEVRGSRARVRFRVNGDMEPYQEGGERTNGFILGHPAREAIAYAFNFVNDRGTATGSNFNSSEKLEWIIPIELKGEQIKLRSTSVPVPDGFDFTARFTHKNRSFSYDAFGYLPWHQQMIERAVARREGIITLAGKPNSGKSTAARMLLESQTKSDKQKIISTEIPIESTIEGVTQILLTMDESNQDEAKRIFDGTLQFLVRNNPDILFLGEVRSKSSAEASIVMAESGTLLIDTIHANNCLGIFQKKVTLGVDIHDLTAPGLMNLFVHQTLVQVLCKECKVPLSSMPSEVRAAMHETGERLDVEVSGMYYKADHSDCGACRGTGIQGQTIVCEMMEHDTRILDLVVRRDLVGALEYWQSKSDGRYDTLDFTGKSSFYHAFILAQRGIISPLAVQKFGFFEDYPEPASRQNNGSSGKSGNSALCRIHQQSNEMPSKYAGISM